MLLSREKSQLDKHILNFLNNTLKKHNWLGEYEIVEIQKHSFTVKFELDEDAYEYESIMAALGFKVDLHTPQ